MMRYFVAGIALVLLAACSSAPPPAKFEAATEPKVADDLPTWCSGETKPCVPSRDFATRLCRGQFAGAALFLFQKQSPWQRRWVNAKAGLPAKNGEGGPAGSALEHAEELLVVAVDEPAEAIDTGKKSKRTKKPDPELLALRWDGTCVSLKGSDAATSPPGTPKHPTVAWLKLDPFVQRSLLRETDVQRDASARDKACAQSSASADCQKADEALSNSIVAHIRRGAKLSMPEQRP